MILSHYNSRRLAAAILMLPIGLVTAAAQAPGKLDFSKIDRRVADWQPTRDERRFDDIPWVEDLRTALKLAKKSDRPVFLFTHDGRMNIGRC
jgi:hypothetical protein